MKALGFSVSHVGVKGSFGEHVANDEMYGDLPRVTEKSAYRRMGLAGHCHRYPELPPF